MSLEKCDQSIWRRIVSAGSMIAMAAMSPGCGGPLVDSSPTQSLPPASMTPVRNPATPTQSEFSKLPRVPTSSVMPSNGGQTTGRYYEVRSGDTLTGIAKMAGTTVERLLESNGLDPNTVLQPGQLVYIPEAP